jgi:hypothetical protein
VQHPRFLKFGASVPLTIRCSRPASLFRIQKNDHTCFEESSQFCLFGEEVQWALWHFLSRTQVVCSQRSAGLPLHFPSKTDVMVTMPLETA